MKRLIVLSVVIIVILLSFNSIGCQQKTEPATAPSPELTPTTKPNPAPTPAPTPTPTTTETDSSCVAMLMSFGLRGYVDIQMDRPIPEPENAMSDPEPEWCFYHPTHAIR